MTSRTRVRVDFNSRGAGGTVRASMRRADGPLAVGDVVEAYDPAEPDMTFEATVAQLDEGSGRALLDVHWKPRVAVTALSFGAGETLTLSPGSGHLTIGGNRFGAAGVRLAS